MRAEAALLATCALAALAGIAAADVAADTAHAEMLSVMAVSDCFENNTAERAGPRASRLRVSYTDPEYYVSLANILDDLDIAHVEALAQCIKKHVAGRMVARKFQGAPKPVLSLDIHGYLQAAMPSLTEYLIAAAGIAADKAGWRPHPFHMGIRTAEIVEYDVGDVDLRHVDDGAMYTLVVSLAAPNATGGVDHIKTTLATDEYVPLPDAPRDGYLAYTLASRVTAAMTTGSRRVLVVELWPYEPAPLGRYRPSMADKPELRQPFFFSVRTAYDSPDDYYFVEEAESLLDGATGGPSGEGHPRTEL